MGLRCRAMTFGTEGIWQVRPLCKIFEISTGSCTYTLPISPFVPPSAPFPTTHRYATATHSLHYDVSITIILSSGLITDHVPSLSSPVTSPLCSGVLLHPILPSKLICNSGSLFHFHQAQFRVSCFLITYMCV